MFTVTFAVVAGAPLRVSLASTLVVTDTPAVVVELSGLATVLVGVVPGLTVTVTTADAHCAGVVIEQMV